MKAQACLVGLMAVIVGLAPDDPKHLEAQGIGKSYQVPYVRSETNHYLVRVRINGQGPFNFLVDTGAPALYIATETAAKVGLKPSETDFWTNVDRLDFEGGGSLESVQCRVDDPFQLIGMNALGLPGVSIDGILGFNVLARFRIEMDPTKDRMTWTRLDYEPKLPNVPKNADDRAPAAVKAMSLVGPFAKMMAFFVGKQPETEHIRRGRLGIEFDPAALPLRIATVWPDSPASKAGLAAGDVIESLNRKSAKTLQDARKAIAEVPAGKAVSVVITRGGERKEVEVKAEEGL